MHKLPVRHLTATLSDEEVRLLKGTLIEPHQIATIVTKSEIGIMPNGQPLYALVTEAFPYRYCDQAYLPALKVASDPVIGGMRADAAGVKLQPRMRKDGTLGGRLEVPFTERLVGAKTGHFGFYDYEDGRLQGRLTDFSATNWGLHEKLHPLARAVDRVFRTYLPDRYAALAAAASLVHPLYLLPGTCFSTCTINNCWQTAVHADKHNVRSGLGALTMLTAGTHSGGELAFPQFGIAVRYGMRDVLLADGSQWHGNLPIHGIAGTYNRLSMIFYLREDMMKACPAATASEPSPAPPAENVPIPPPADEPRVAIIGVDQTADGDAGEPDRAEPRHSSEQPDASESEHFARAIKFGRDLITTQDLDPVYTAIHGAGLPYDMRARLLLAYSCLYHLGASVTIAQRQGADYWDGLMVAAVNDGHKWPRASERRHWRGQQALHTVTYLRNKYRYPEDVVGYWATGGDASFTAVTDRVKEIPIFGPWIAFKLADMLERVMGHQVDFSTCAMGVYKEPRAAAALILSGDAEANIADSDLERVMQQMLLPEHLGTLRAPPDFARPVNVQEIETCLCKYKSHVNGNYEPGKDTLEVLHGLKETRWENSITRRMVQVLETLPYARLTPQAAGKRKAPRSETLEGLIHKEQMPNQ